ncbi:MAG TPA: metalloregulator ArsR/SmtB family transcription factor [Planctomycetota bacterium]|nr:metalloregulator ArsR/SmtB family transcription factor [Planctomycetota bacterium]
MKKAAPPAGGNTTRRAITRLLKTEGPLEAADLAKRLRLTAMAVRQHLYALQNEKLVTAEERPRPIGRPAKYWQLTSAADRLFPEAYAELTVTLINALQEAFGPAGLEKVIEGRCGKQRADYAARIGADLPLAHKLKRLAQVRSEEGYMAEVQAEGRGRYLFVENHCPICAAANACKGFCSTELNLFREVVGPGVQVERTEHIVNGDRRCAYRIAPRNIPVEV